MIQTLVLANSVHRPHSQISMSILSLSLFHKIVEIRNCGLNAHLMSSSSWSWYPCLVLKIVILLKNSFTTVCSWKTRAFVACWNRSERFGSVVWTSTQNWVRLYSCRLCSSISCSAMQSTSQWTCNSGTSKELRTQLNVLMWLWEGIYLSIAERCWKALKKIWQMQSK